MQFISACFGGQISMYFASYAMISDTHGNKKPAGKSAKTDRDAKISSKQSPDKENPTIQNGHKDSNESEKVEKVTSEANASASDDEVDIDMSRENTRTLKIVALDVVRRLSASIISFATGYIIQYAGFFYTCVIVVCGKALLFIFAYFFITETGEQKKSMGFRAPLR